jgi:catechol 2,3-dioxygenase-like lactoylglutathione lyase family enzyme
MHLDYSGVRVTDLDRAIAFYTGPVGFQEVRRGTADHGGIWVLLEDPISHQRVELNWYPKGNKYATPYVTGEALDHLGFRVTDIGAAVEALVQGGAQVVERFSEGGSDVVVYLRDPDGIELELISTPYT